MQPTQRCDNNNSKDNENNNKNERQKVPYKTTIALLVLVLVFHVPVDTRRLPNNIRELCSPIADFIKFFVSIFED